MSLEKRAIRQLLREQRRALSTAVVEAAGAGVLAQLHAFRPYQVAAAVIAYIANENEIPTARLLDDIVRSGRTLYLPQSTVVDGVIRWQPGEPLRAGQGGVFEPVRGSAMHPDLPAIALVPLVGWDASGTRLGRGGGFYDRLLAQLPQQITRVGLAYEFQEVPELPRDPWDVPLHYVITERRILRCGSEVVREGSLQKGGLQL
jgi:5-formyltetrahydrofolate cyclo-ligase